MLRVRVPLRIVLDRQSLGDVAEVRSAVVAAVGRALATSRTAVLEKRGGYVQPRCRPADITWRLPARMDVPRRSRVAVEAAVRDGLLEAAVLQGLVDTAVADSQGPVFGRGAAETVDPARMNWPLGVYGIPSYDDDDGEVITVDVRSLRRNAELDVEQGSISFDLAVRDAKYLAALYKVACAKFGEPTGAMVGLLFEPRPSTYMLLFWRRDRLESFVGFNFTLQSRHPTLRGNTITWEMRRTSLASDKFTVERLRNEAAKAALAENYRLLLEPILVEAKPKSMSTTELEQLIDRIVEQEAVNTMRSRVAAGQPQQLRLLAGEVESFVAAPDGPPFDFEDMIEVLPLGFGTDLPTPGAGGQTGTGAGGAGDSSGSSADGAASGDSGPADTGGAGSEPTERGSFVYSDEAPPGSVGVPSFPELASTQREKLASGPLLDEPKLDELGADAEALRRLIRQIAYLLQIPTDEYAARFCVNAATVLGMRAGGVARVAATGRGKVLTKSAGAQGNLGAVQFVPQASPAIQFLRHLARVVPRITQLSELLQQTYARHKHLVGGTWGGRPVSWNLHFLHELSPAMKDSVGFVFGSGCQVLLLQLLRQSRDEIDSRLANFATYAHNFERFLVPEMARIERLIELRNRLQAVAKAMKFTGVVATAATQLVIGSWSEATTAVVDSLRAGSGRSDLPTAAGQIRIGNDNVPRIADESGRVWGIEGLEQSIQSRRGFLEQAEPLVKQLLELDDVMARFRSSPVGVQVELRRILETMSASNAEKTKEAEESWVFAFRASKIREDLPRSTVRGCKVALQGIHLQVHEQIGEFFEGDGYYGRGLDALFGAELGRQSIGNFIEFVGLTFLAVVFPPAAMVVGAGLALHALHEAHEREELYEALIDPELVLTRAEIEADLFAAKLGLLLSFLPDVGAVLGKGASIVVRQGVRTAARGAAASVRSAMRQGARGAGRAIANRFTREMVERLEQSFVAALAKELAADQVMEAVIGKLLLQPAVERLMREVSITGPAGRRVQ